MRLSLVRLAGLTLGLVFGFAAVSLQAQAPKITATGGWNLCVDAAVATLAEAQAITVTLRIDGAAAINASGVTWTGSGPFTANIPLSQMPAAARTVGTHAAVVAFVTTAGAPIVLADGSTLTPSPGTPLTISYEVVAQPTGPSPTNPRWIKILGTVALAIGAALVAFFKFRA